MDELAPELCAVGSQNSFRSLLACLKRVEDDMKTAERYRTICI